MPSRILCATAHHEAGHAVIAWTLRLRFKRISIISSSDSFGHVLFVSRNPAWADPLSTKYDLERSRQWFERWARTSLAGGIAESKHLGRRPRFGYNSDDFTDCLTYADGACSSRVAAKAWLKWLWIETEQSVERYWGAIQAVAAALLDCRQLTAREAVSIIEATVGNEKSSGNHPRISIPVLLE